MGEVTLSKDSIEELAMEIVEKLFEVCDGEAEENGVVGVILKDLYAGVLKRQAAEKKDAKMQEHAESKRSIS